MMKVKLYVSCAAFVTSLYVFATNGVDIGSNASPSVLQTTRDLKPSSDIVKISGIAGYLLGKGEQACVWILISGEAVLVEVSIWPKDLVGRPVTVQGKLEHIKPSSPNVQARIPRQARMPKDNELILVDVCLENGRRLNKIKKTDKPISLILLEHMNPTKGDTNKMINIKGFTY